MLARMDEGARAALKIVGLFLFARLMMVMALPLEGLYGYGDYQSFFAWSMLPGWPYLHYWSEFPPVFPFLSEILFRLANNQMHVYAYLLFFVLTAADAGNLYLFTRLSQRLWPSGASRPWIYLVLLACLPYTWWYFDPLAVLPMLFGLNALLEQKPLKAGLLFGLGAITKLFPALGILAAWRSMSWKKGLLMVAAAASVVILSYGVLMIASPDFTTASLRSQGSKGAWETVWALIDGNYGTGLFGPVQERLDPATASTLRGNPPRVPTWLTLIVFGALGLWGALQVRPQTDRQRVALVGFAFCLLYLWSPGWSPQWLLFLLPCILLVFEERKGFLLAGTFVLANLVEWPVLLSRGGFALLSLTIPLRTALLALMAVLFYQSAATPEQPGERLEALVAEPAGALDGCGEEDQAAMLERRR